MSLSQFSMFPNQVATYAFDFLSSDALLQLLAATTQPKKIGEEDTLRLSAIEILLSRSKTLQDIEYQTKTLALCLRTQKDLDDLKIHTQQIIKNITLENSTLEHKIQSLVFLCKIHQIPLSKTLRDNLFDQYTWRYYRKPLLPLLSERSGQLFLKDFKRNYLQDVHVLSILPREQVRENLDHFLSIFINSERDRRLERAIAQMPYLKIIASELETDQIILLLEHIEHEAVAVKCLLWSLLFPQLTQTQKTIAFHQVMVFLEGNAIKYAFYALENFWPELTYPQRERAFQFALENKYLVGTDEIITRIASEFGIGKINSILQQLHEELNNTKERIAPLRLTQFIFIFLNTLAAKTQGMERSETIKQMMSLLKHAPPDFYYNKNIHQVLSHLAPDIFEQYFNFIVTTLEEKRPQIPYPLRIIISKLSHCFNDAQLNILRAYLRPLLTIEDNRPCKLREIFYKLASGITTDEISTCITLLSSNEIDEQGNQLEINTNGLNKFIAQIAPELQKQADKDKAFEMFINIINENIETLNIRTFHFFMYRFTKFIPCLTPPQINQAASLLKDQLFISSQVFIADGLSLDQPNELMPFETIDSISHVHRVHTGELIQYALKLVLQKMDANQSLALLKTLCESNKSGQKNQFACNEISGRLFRGEIIDIDLHAEKESEEAQLFISLLDIITDTWNKLSSIIEQCTPHKPNPK